MVQMMDSLQICYFLHMDLEFCTVHRFDGSIVKLVWFLIIMIHHLIPFYVINIILKFLSLDYIFSIFLIWRPNFVSIVDYLSFDI